MFVAIYDLLQGRKWLCWLLFFSTLTAAGLLASRVHFVEDISDSLPDSKSLRTMNNVVSKTQAGEQLLFLLSFRDTSRTEPDSLITATNNYVSLVQNECSAYIDTVMLQAGSEVEEGLTTIISDHLPMFLDAKDYVSIDSLTQPDRINRTLAKNKEILMSPASVVYKQLIAKDPLGIAGLAWKKLTVLQGEGDYELYDGYIFSSSQRKLTFFIKPRYKASETGKNAKFLDQLENITHQWEAQHPDIHLAWFGGPAVAVGNATQLRTDTILTLSVTVVLLTVLILYYFRKKRTPLMLLTPVAYGALMGLATVYLVQGKISVIALAAGAIVLGIAMDYAIHFLSHSLHVDSMRQTVKDLQQPLTLGSFTTIAAFLSLGLVHTPILRDLGLFAAASLIGAALCTLVFLPHFPFGEKKISERKNSVFDKLANLHPERSKPLVLGILLLTPLLAYYSFKVEFDDDLMHLNYMSPELTKAQDELVKANAGAMSAVFVVAEGRSEEEALQRLESITPAIDSLTKNGLIRSSSNPVTLVPSKSVQEQKAKRWFDFWHHPENKPLLVAQNISLAAVANGYAPEAFSGFKDNVSVSPSIMDSSESALLKQLFPGGFASDPDHHYAIAQLKVAPQYRKAVFEGLKEREGVTVTDRQQGASQLAGLLSNDFNRIALYTSLLVFFALLLGYGRIELALISFLPMVVSWIWILGLMGLMHLKFNIVNIIISTLIFGLGDDYTIFTMDGLVERFRSGRKDDRKLHAVRSAVYVSVATVLIGLGALLLAKHPALRSIAFISVTGLICVVFISQTLQPFLFNWFIQKRADKKLLPFTFLSFFKSVYAFAYFFSGAWVLSILGFLLTRLWPFGKERGRFLFHRCISAYTWSMMYIMGNVRKQIYNRHLGDFSKPAIYIANHSSFLDILITTMLNPRLVLLTNRWVWRSPVFGAVVRMAEYYPVADGAEQSIEPLRDLVSRGYSIIIFPEGTRSYTDKIGRFHKGAFYLAEQLKMDVVPLILHGVGYTMQKGDWLLKDGTCSIYYNQRIGLANDRFSTDYSQRTKEVSSWFRNEFRRIKEQNETPKYFRERLLRCYTYKGPVLEWYCRIKTSLEGNYELFHSLLPREGLIYDLGCGYGFATYLLHWSAPARTMVGIDYDEEKIEAASGNFLKDEQISFASADVLKVELQLCNGLIISDVLHYLLPAEQEQLLQRAYDVLRPGGVMIIRDGIEELEGRHKGTRLSELFSTRVFGFNKTRNDLHFISRKMLNDFASKNNLEMKLIDNTKRTSNLTFVFTKH